MPKSIKEPKRILISSLHNIGDLIAKIPLMRLLKKQFPNCRIILLTRAYTIPLTPFIECIDKVIEFNDFFNREKEEIVANLISLKLDVIIHILSVESIIGPDIYSLAKLAKIPIRIGNIRCSKFKNFLNKKGLTHNVRSKRILPDIHEFLWNLKVLQCFNLTNHFSLEEIKGLIHLVAPEKILKSCLPFIDRKKFNLMIHPGSHGNAKEWSTDYFIKLIKALDPLIFNIILTGSQKEAKLYNELILSQSNIQNTMGKLNLEELIHLICIADGLLASSTGPAHLSAIFGKKTLSLFPKQDVIGAGIWQPIGKQATYISGSFICKPCQKKLTDFDAGICKCMDSISVEAVKNHLHLWQDAKSANSL